MESAPQRPQRLVVQICFGPLAGKKLLIPPGESRSIGRRERADFVIAHDEKLSAVHVQIGWDGSICKVSSVEKSSGFLLYGESTREATIDDGGHLKVGSTNLLIHHEGLSNCELPPPEEDEDEIDPDGDEAYAKREFLRVARENERAFRGLLARTLHSIARTERLFVVLDAARDPILLPMLAAAAEEYRSLYEGAGGDALADVAPYLVKLEPGSALVDRLVWEGFGRRFGIFLASSLSFKEMRTQLRRFLMVEDAETGEKLYFRFYDPDVLRTFLPSTSLKQATDFWRGIDEILCEDEDGDLLRFGREPMLAQAAAHTAAE